MYYFSSCLPLGTELLFLFIHFTHCRCVQVTAGQKELMGFSCPCEQQEIKFRSIRSLQCNLKLDWLLTRYIYHCQCEPVHFHVPNAGSINVIANKAFSWIPKKADTQTLFILPWYWKWNSSDNRLFSSLWMYMGKTQIHVFYSLSSMKTILYFKC